MAMFPALMGFDEKVVFATITFVLSVGKLDIGCNNLI